MDHLVQQTRSAKDMLGLLLEVVVEPHFPGDEIEHDRVEV
jgi:hypothetical protein